MGKRDVRCAEGRHSFDPESLEIFAPKDDYSFEPFEPCLAQSIDFGIVSGGQGGNAVALPGAEPAVKACGISFQDLFVELVAPHDKRCVGRDVGSTNARNTLGHVLHGTGDM